MATRKVAGPPDDDYYVDKPWTEQILQGDIFLNVPLGMIAPPDAILIAEGERRFVTGPFDAGPAMLISPSCAIAAQGKDIEAGQYAHPARILIPIRPLDQLVEAGAIPSDNVGLFRADRLANYLYLPEGPEGPEGPGWPESAGLLYLPITIHHDVIAQDRAAQLTGSAFWQLRYKLMAFIGGFKVHPDEFGPVPGPGERVN